MGTSSPVGPDDGPVAPVAVDAMGGDHAPAAVVEGALAAHRAGIPVLLVGDEARIRPALAGLGVGPDAPPIVHAPEVVEMGDQPAQAIRQKKQSSIRVCFELVKSGQACGMVSAGNSGAVMAGAIFVLGRLGPVERPAIVSVLPAARGRRALLLDAGANTECKPSHLVQFGLMGEVYSRRVLKVERPRLAVLSNGEEPSKGTELTRLAAAALAESGLDYRGYCEGRDLLTGELDVIVTDGFTGNVALKAMEGTEQLMRALIRDALSRSWLGRLGGLLARRSFDAVRKRVDWREVGGAPLLGIAGVAIISHGKSDGLAVENAIRRAVDAARAHALEEMGAAAARADGLLEGAKAKKDKVAS